MPAKRNPALRTTPQEVLDLIAANPGPRQPAFDPTLGISLPPPDGAGQKHRLVTLGDSLTHGFQSGAIFHTDFSWPAIIAWEMGVYDEFRRPQYPGFGGLPLNLEFLIRDMESKYGNQLDPWDVPSAVFHLPHLLDQIEDYWERGAGAKLPGNGAAIMHNLAVFGFDVRELISFTDDTAAARIARQRDQSWLQNQTVENPMEIAARRVLHSARAGSTALSPVQAAQALGDDGGIETLVVAIGANNALGTVLSLYPQWTDSTTDYADLDRKSAFNVWRPSHFKKEYDLLLKQIEKVNASHVILTTVPQVTIAPIARGVGTQKVHDHSRYFPFYTRPWIDDSQFNQQDDPFITADEARAIDAAIDAYNRHIVQAVADARKAGKDWYLFDMAGVLDRLATRRYKEDPRSRPDWWSPYELPAELRGLKPELDTRFFVAGPEGRTQGGIFSLDGVHGTTVTYGLVAQEVINIMQRAGVKFRLGNGQERFGPVGVDFSRLLRNDTLLRQPPASLRNQLRLLGWIDEKTDFFNGIVGK